MPKPRMETCPFCRARVPRGTLGYHYAGYRQAPCPDVTKAFGPAEPRTYGPGPQLPPDSWEQGREARQPCAVAGCREPVYQAGRCLEHRREIVKRQRERDRAKARAKQLEQGRVSA